MDNFHEIHWYYKLKQTEGPPTVSYVDGKVSGEGFDLNEFNIQPDGSLIINNVTVQHETTFTVVEFETLQDPPKSSEINVKTIGK